MGILNRLVQQHEQCKKCKNEKCKNDMEARYQGLCLRVGDVARQYESHVSSWLRFVPRLHPLPVPLRGQVD